MNILDKVYSSTVKFYGDSFSTSFWTRSGYTINGCGLFGPYSVTQKY